MCAISGCVGLPIEETCMHAMLQTMARRGPDGRGIFRNADCTLLHTRLAIIDPTGGAQPMELLWGGEHYCITYNGELYNTEQLRKKLENWAMPLPRIRTQRLCCTAMPNGGRSAF